MCRQYDIRIDMLCVLQFLVFVFCCLARKIQLYLCVCGVLLKHACVSVLTRHCILFACMHTRFALPLRYHDMFSS